jgi:hypothetical protein
MSIEIIEDRSPVKSASVVYLKLHIDYLSDALHDDHIYTVGIHQPKFYNLKIASVKGFISAVKDAQNAYLKFRDGIRGKRTDSLWDETIYRTPDNTDLTPDERIIVEKKMLTIRRGSPALTQWHYNYERGSWDLHVLSPTKSSDWPPRVLLTSRFGAGKEHVFAEMDRLDQEIADALNEHRKPDQQIVSKIERKKERAIEAIGVQPSLASEIASITMELVTRANLVKFVQLLGHQIKRRPGARARFLSVIFEGRKQTRRIDIEERLVEIAEIQRSLKAPNIEPDLNAPARESAGDQPPAKQDRDEEPPLDLP